MKSLHQEIKLDTDNGHNQEVIARFNRIAKHFDLTELPSLLQSYMDDQDISSFSEMMEERISANQNTQQNL